MKKVALLMLTLALSVASARSFDVTLYKSSVVAGTELQPGDYKLELNGTKMVLKNGQSSAECDVRVEISGKKFDHASVRYGERDGKFIMREIRLRGTDMKLVLAEPAGSTAGGQ
jgi:hypothetical protein